MSSGLSDRSEYRKAASPDKAITLTRVALFSTDNRLRSEIAYTEDFRFVLEYQVNENVSGVSIGVGLFTGDGTCALTTADFDAHPELLGARTPGKYQTEVSIPGEWLNTGRYSLDAYVASKSVVYDSVEAMTFNIVDNGTPGSRNGVQRRGILQPVLDWKTSTV